MPGRMPKSGRNSNSRSANHPPAVTISANQQFLGIAVDEFGMSQVVNTTVSSMNGGRSQLYANNADNASTDDINESVDDNKSTMVIALLISGVVFVIVIGIIRFIFGWRQRQQQDMVDYQHVHQTGQQEQHLYSDAGSGADGIRSQERAWERANERLSRSLQTRSDDRTPLHVVQIAS
jgi:ATP-dependent Zn protease